MSEKKYEKLTILQLVSEIESKAESLHPDIFGDEEQAEPTLTAKEIALAAGYIEVKFRTFRILLYMCLSGILTAVMIGAFLFEDNQKIKALNDRLIESSQPTEFDSIKDKIILDSVGNISYSVDNAGRPIPYKTLLRENTRLQDSLQTTNYLLNLAVENYGLKYSVKKKGNNIIYTMSSSLVEQQDKTIKDATDAINSSNARTRKLLDSLPLK